MTDTIIKERVIENAQNIYDMFVSNYGFSSVLALDMKTVLDSLRAALAQQEKQGWQPTNAAMDALRRFEETCTDNEGYDVPKDTMRNLQAIGLIYRTYGDMYCITDFGNYMLAAAPKGGV